jgi:hypothetical protein
MMGVHMCPCGKPIPSRRRYCSRACYAAAERAARPAIFWAKVRKGPGCWEYEGLRKDGRYGYFGGKYAHRVAFELTHGPIPPGLLVRHKCDNKPCVRPDHLELGTNEDNMADAKERKRFTEGHYRVTNPKLSPEIVRQIRALAAAGRSNKDLASRFGVGHSAIWEIVTRRTWPEVT